MPDIADDADNRGPRRDLPWLKIAKAKMLPDRIRAGVIVLRKALIDDDVQRGLTVIADIE